MRLVAACFAAPPPPPTPVLARDQGSGIHVYSAQWPSNTRVFGAGRNTHSRIHTILKYIPHRDSALGQRGCAKIHVYSAPARIHMKYTIVYSRALLASRPVQSGLWPGCRKSRIFYSHFEKNTGILLSHSTLTRSAGHTPGNQQNAHVHS